MRIDLLGSMISLFSVVVMVGCSDYEQIHRQLPTFADMLNMSRYIQRVVGAKGFATHQEFAEVIQTSGKVDRWGNPYIYKIRNSPEFSFIFVSLGADGMLDVADIDLYFEMKQVDIVGDLDHDIVTRNGTWVTAASNK